MASVNDFAAQDLGNISINPRGEYDSEATYEYLDTVSYGGGTYMCIVLTEAGVGVVMPEPESGVTNDYWQCITIPATLTDEYIALQEDVAANAASALASKETAASSEKSAASSAVIAEKNAETATEAATASGENKDVTAGYMYQAQQAANAAASSEKSAASSETNAAASESAAAKSASEAATSADKSAKEAASIEGDTEAAAESAAAAKASAEAAAKSETNASASEVKAKASEENAATSETNAKASETSAAKSEANAAASADSAASSATEAATSAKAAAESAAAALVSETNAKASETNAATSETKAATSASSAASSASAASLSETNASTSATSASSSASSAAASANSASESEANAKASEESAKASEEVTVAAAESIASDCDYALLSGLDGTVEGYMSTMRLWFRAHGSDDATSEELTALCDKWYTVTRPAWDGYTEFYQPDVSAVTYGTKGGDNAGLTCVASTDTTKGQDDYEALPLFACVDCNFEVDADTLRPVITAIDGVTDNFERTNPEKYVGVLQMSGYLYVDEAEETYTIGYTANYDADKANIEPLPDAVQPDDNSMRSWVVHAKYMSHTVNSKMSSYAGVIPTAFVSHNTVHTLSKANGAQYSGATTSDDLFLKLMMFIKYGSLTMDGIIQGCLANNYQYPAQAAESGVKRVLISTSNNLEVGMGVLVGYYNSAASSPLERGAAALYSTTGQAGAIITKMETVTISETATDEETSEETTTDTEYCAVYLDVDESFDTAANGTATEGTTYISTFHWPTGTTDSVLGNDGSPKSNTSGKYPGKIQGIEIMNGAYEILADVIWSLYQNADDEKYYYEPYIVRQSANQSTAITDNYEATGLTCEQPSASAWTYIKKLGYALGVFAPIEVGGSSSTYTRDAFYMNAATTGTREWLARGNLANGSARGGLSYVNGYYALSPVAWYCASRLSAGGNRGEWAA